MGPPAPDHINQKEWIPPSPALRDQQGRSQQKYDDDDELEFNDASTLLGH